MDLAKEKGLYFVPLGGSEQFGVNLNVYVHDGEFLAVDCGIGFADEYFPGIDLLLPDPTLLENNRKKIKGMVITHAHEDHVGAVAYLWDRLRCPLYCSEFTAVVLGRKMEEQGHKDYKLHIIQPLKEFSVGSFNLQLIPVSHSVPDTCALLLEAGGSRIMHSGDWNLDPSPVVGPVTDAKTFKAIGKKGVLAYIGDSTNAEVPGRSGSESCVAEGLAKEFAHCKGKILITIFSSNIGRIVSIARAAQACGRHVGVIGRSLHRMIGAAKTCGYMDDIEEFVSEGDLGLIPDDNLVVIATGSQGEARAALPKISRGEHPVMSLNRGDTVIFSSRAIPGNEVKINAVKNNLSAAGVEVITPRDTENTIHVSGHPCRDEIVDMFGWLKPETVIPVHGEHTMLQAHAALAKQCQVKNTIVPKNGSVILLAPGTPKIVDHIDTDVLALDQKRIIAATHQSISDRRKLQYTGAVHLSLVLDSEGNLMIDPKLETIGLVDPEDEREIDFEDDLYAEVLDLLDEISWKKRKNDDFVEEELRIGIRRFVYHFLNIKPKTTVHVLRG